MNGVQDMDRGSECVTSWLQIPRSKQTEIKQRYDSAPHRKREYIDYWLSHNLAPTWKVIAVSLWEAGELGALEVVQKLYFKGKPYEYIV